MGEYERQRAMHVARNAEYMRRLGVGGGAGGLAALLSPSVSGVEGKKRKRREAKADRSRVEPTRRSGRLIGLAAEHPEGVAYDDSDENEEEAGDVGRKGGESPAAPLRTTRSQEELEELTAQWLARSREALLRVPSDAAGGDGDVWKEEAVRRWGSGVLTSGASDWGAYVRSRVSCPPPPSKHGLLQEFYAHDGWRLLAVCVLMSRVASHRTKHEATSAFFSTFDTPTSFMEMASAAGDPSSEHRPTLTLCKEIMHPLGLFDNRFRALVSLSEAWLTKPEFAIEAKGPNKVWGLGQFAVDSYRIFCEGDTAFKPTDKTLAR